ncbi:MAG: phage tail protein [Proteobacteria bacterium]|nr:MAG: phage tail protein [Pseudomonadota bacterium]
MSEPFVGEIRMFAGNFAPRGWAFCDGQLLAISQNDALFSLLGTIYGGDGRTTFGLPDMRGRIPNHAGHGPGLSDRRLGAKYGMEQESLTVNQLPSHNHPFQVSSAAGTQSNNENQFLATSSNVRVYRPVAANTSLEPTAITNTGSSQPHNNMMPFLCINFIIALVGIYPSRT